MSTTLLQELFELISEESTAGGSKKKTIKTAAKRVYHRDYLRTRNKPYRKYDPKKHQESKD